MNLFHNFETEVFPEHECTIENEAERDILDSGQRYLCVVVDERFPSECVLRVLTPYTADDPDSQERLFGWTNCADGGEWFDHRERAIHCDHTRVMAWKKIDEEVDFWKLFNA
jgi:hypothetical protein